MLTPGKRAWPSARSAPRSSSAAELPGPGHLRLGPRGQAEQRERDLRIIELLSVDGRLTNREIATRVDLTETTVAARIRSLEDRHVLGVSAVLDWEAAGFTYDLWLMARVEDRPVEDVAAEVAGLDGVHVVDVVSGSADIVAHVLLRDRESAARFLATDLARIPSLREVRLGPALCTVKYLMNFAALPIENSPVDCPDPVVALDDLDHTLIGAFIREGRRPIRELGRDLDIPDSTIRLRLRRLEQAGLLRICARTDPTATGLARAWAYVGLELAGPTWAEVVQSVAASPEVLVVIQTGGSPQLLMLMAGPSRRRLTDFLLRKVRTLDGVRSAETWWIIDRARLDFHWGRLL